MARVVDVLDDLFDLPVTLGAVDVLEGRQCAFGDALGRPRLRAVQLPYQAVIHSDRMLSIVPVMCMQRNSKLFTFSTAVPSMWIGACSLCCFLKSKIGSFVLLTLRERLFSWQRTGIRRD
jgi:hypothetical protein